MAYYQALRLAAEGYDAPGLEAELLQYPQVISSIEGQTVSKTS